MFNISPGTPNLSSFTKNIGQYYYSWLNKGVFCQLISILNCFRPSLNSNQNPTQLYHTNSCAVLDMFNGQLSSWHHQRIIKLQKKIYSSKFWNGSTNFYEECLELLLQQRYPMMDPSISPPLEIGKSFDKIKQFMIEYLTRRKSLSDI